MQTMQMTSHFVNGPWMNLQLSLYGQLLQHSSDNILIHPSIVKDSSTSNQGLEMTSDRRQKLLNSLVNTHTIKIHSFFTDLANFISMCGWVCLFNHKCGKTTSITTISNTTIHGESPHGERTDCEDGANTPQGADALDYDYPFIDSQLLSQQNRSPRNTYGSF